jgi:hypothetical protein
LLSIKGLVPHRLCGSHENNPASRWETYSLLAEDFDGEEVEGEVRLLKGNVVNVYEYNFGHCVAVVEHPGGADDLPCLEWRCELADPHNAEGPRPTEEQLARELESLTTIEKRPLSRPKVFEVKVSGEWLCEERGYLVDWGSFKHLVVFGNNMKKDSKRPADLVSTVDDHSCAGFGRSTYEPCSVESYEIINEKLSALKVARKTKRYRAMGEGMLSEEAQRTIVRSIKLGIAMVGLSVLLSFI